MSARTRAPRQPLPTYFSTPAYEKLNYVRVTHTPVKLWERILLGNLSFFGHRNQISGPLRIGSAGVQTFWSSILLFLVLKLFRHLEIMKDGMLGDEAGIGLLAILAGVFGATFYNERSNMHSKWNYLAELFNSVLTLPTDTPNGNPNPQREHMWACLAQDILITEMWAHKTFAVGFKFFLEKAIAFEEKGNLTRIHRRLITIANDGIPFDTARQLFSSYIDHMEPPSDQPGFAIYASRLHKRNVPWN